MRFVIVFLFFYISGIAHVTAGDPLRTLPNKAFPVGEKLKFSIGWEFISAGTATLEVEQLTAHRDRPCYLVSATTVSNAFFSTLYPVKDRLESYIDQDGLYPLKYVKNTSEGGYKRNFTTEFYHEQRKATIDDRDSGYKEIAIPEMVQDIISAFYYLRNQPLEIGKTLSLATYDNGKINQATVKVVRKETISVDAGEFHCILVQTPIGPFNNKSDLNIWLTDDDRKIPVLMKSKIAIGSVRAELVEMSGTF